MTSRCLVAIFALVSCTHCSNASSVESPVAEVTASAQTESIQDGGDAADDPSIWIHPSDPTASLIIATNKRGGLAVYDLTGKQLQYQAGGLPNNVDLHYDFPLGDRAVALVVTGDREANRLVFYEVDAETRRLRPLVTKQPPLGFSPYGVCTYKSAVSGAYYAFVTSKQGEVQQWRLLATDDGEVAGERVRAWQMSSATEGCVADDRLGLLYLSEEERGVWRFGAEPGTEVAPRLVGRVKPEGRLTGDIEGLALYYGDGAHGYLLVSSQGSNEFHVYRRDGANEWVGAFRIVAGEATDGVTHADGISVSSAPLGPAFPHGLLVVQDDQGPEGRQNFKLVPWERIADAIAPNLTKQSSWNPRAAR